MSTAADTSVLSSPPRAAAELPPALPPELAAALNQRLKMDGAEFLAQLPAASFKVAFFDPQYRGVLDKLSYGNEGAARGKARCSLPQMGEALIAEFIRGLDAALAPSGHLFLWIDKFHLCEGFLHWLAGTELAVVDMLTWDKVKIGMGYRTRRRAEYVVVLQKRPTRAKDVWKSRSIPDVWAEAAERGGFVHQKPVKLQAELIKAVSGASDIVIDPAAGSFSVLTASKLAGRDFLGADING